MKRLIGLVIVSAALGSSLQVQAMNREEIFDALVHAAIYTKLCGATLSSKTQRMLSAFEQTYRMGNAVQEKLRFAEDFTSRYPSEKEILCSDTKRDIEELEGQFK
jgi:hypothetical protein